jgi:hypothetical protein
MQTVSDFEYNFISSQKQNVGYVNGKVRVEKACGPSYDSPKKIGGNSEVVILNQRSLMRDNVLMTVYASF